MPAKPDPAKPNVEITYCRLCGWGLRASWMAQEILTTFAEEIGSVTLTPDASGGVFEVRADDALIWSRKEHEALPGDHRAQATGARPHRARPLARPFRPCGQSRRGVKIRRIG